MKRKIDRLCQRLYDFIVGNILRKYDFEIRCAFEDQINYEMFWENGQRFAFVPFKSGRLAIYKVKTEQYVSVFEDTGQYNWKFKFIRFVLEREKETK